MLSRHRALVLPTLLGIFVFALYIFTFGNDLQGNGDTLLRFQTTQAIMTTGSVFVHHPEWYDERMVSAYHRPPVTIYDPGQIFAMIPLYIVGKVLAHHVTGDYRYTPIYTTHMLDDIFGALATVLFFFIAVRLGYSRRVSVILALIYAFASVAWPDAESMLEHTEVTFFLLLAVLLTLKFVQTGHRKRRWLGLSGLSIGCAFLTRYDTGVLLPLIPLYAAATRMALRQPILHPVDPRYPSQPADTPWSILRRSWRDRTLVRSILEDWIAYVGGVIPAFVGAAAWNYARFQSFTKTGIPATFGEPILRGLSGLVLSPGKGILWYMPIIFALPFVVRQFYRQHKLITGFFGAIVLVELLLFSTVIYWHGDPAWGPRYIYSATPFLVFPLGIILERWSQLQRLARWSFVGLVALSFSVQLVGVVSPQYRFWYREIHAQLAAHQGFNWGPKYGHFWYYYYWDLNRNPILEGYENLYQITALRLFGQQQYDLTATPIPAGMHMDLSNPNNNYEINNYNLWWLGVRTPFIGTHKDAALAFLWFLLAVFSGALMWKELNYSGIASNRVVVELKRRPA
ncbi:MAG TPA: glycosyltransferase family 39 protein [Chloroflexota bacterium]|nr:glycosyltransferase family 39 protein [Chloroflexota bacterium]